MVKIYRQGDLLFKKIEDLPKKKRKLATDIILEGEATGHAHRIQNGALYSAWADWEVLMYVDAKKGAKIVHEEHAEIELEKGFYEVVRQKEYDPSRRDDRWVED